MAIDVVHEETTGTFEKLIAEIRKLNDEHEVLTIRVTFKREKKPKLRLCVMREDYEQKK